MSESLKCKLRREEPKPLLKKGTFLDSLDLNTGFQALVQEHVGAISDRFESSPKQAFKYVKKDLNDSLEDDVTEEIKGEQLEEEFNLMGSLKKEDWLQESIRESISNWKE